MLWVLYEYSSDHPTFLKLLHGSGDCMVGHDTL